MERYYQRCGNIKESKSISTIEDHNDIIFSFFLHCYHVKDWLLRDPKFTYRCSREHACGESGCPECFVNGKFALNLCREICNGIKHLTPTGAMPGRGSSFDGGVWFYVILSDGTERDAFEVVAQARTAWKDFIKRAVGFASDEEYEENFIHGKFTRFI